MKRILLSTLCILFPTISLLAAAPVPEPGMDCFGIIVGAKASTDGYVYMGHNEDQAGERMLNIYNVPATPERLAELKREAVAYGADADFYRRHEVAADIITGVLP